MPCKLCHCRTREFSTANRREYIQCTGCGAIFLGKKFHLSRQAEKQRYRLHNNDVDDPGYIRFVSPVVEQILADFNKEASGLDFGCGTGAVISSQLGKAGFHPQLYDPYFEPDTAALREVYDYIICCEVMEHFQNPRKEFRLLRSLLKPGGKLYCKTEIWKNSMDFQQWHYKNDRTHVVFYTEQSLEWIEANMGFDSLVLHKDFMVFTT